MSRSSGASALVTAPARQLARVARSVGAASHGRRTRPGARPDSWMNPWVGYGIGIESTAFNGQQSSGSIPNQALHEWLLVGARLVVFP